eukprot:GHVU01168919.1.p1 GENE.GHVU01168919.1~~GHVU01168919.1.p1  ORF type:complete len:119 (+),score=5.81 GHVU01168919.1:370-726(+)
MIMSKILTLLLRLLVCRQRKLAVGDDRSPSLSLLPHTLPNFIYMNPHTFDSARSTGAPRGGTGRAPTDDSTPRPHQRLLKFATNLPPTDPPNANYSSLSNPHSLIKAPPTSRLTHPQE